MGKVIHFEVMVDDLDRAKKFYSMFGWNFSDAGMGYWIADAGEGEGIGGALMQRGDEKQPVTNTISVENIDEMMQKVKDGGGKIVGDVMEIPGVGKFVYGYDTEGNKLGLLQPSS